MRDGRKAVWMIAGILTVVCCVIGGYWLKSSDFFTQLRLRLATSPAPILVAPAAKDQRLCQNGLELLEKTDPLGIGLLGDNAELSVKALHGCISRNLLVYKNHLQGEQAFNHILQRMAGLDAWNMVALNQQADAYIFSSDFDWSLNLPLYESTFEHKGMSRIVIVVIRQCEALAIVNIFITQEDELLSPGVDMSERELTAYANQIYNRMQRLFCSN